MYNPMYRFNWKQNTFCHCKLEKNKLKLAEGHVFLPSWKFDVLIAYGYVTSNWILIYTRPDPAEYGDQLSEIKKQTNKTKTSDNSTNINSKNNNSNNNKA